MTPKILAAAAAALVPAAGLAEPVSLEFVDHITAGMIEQDVYVDKTGDGKLWRVTTEDAADYADATVWATAASVDHAPMDEGRTGPYDAGAELGFTLGQWLAGTGTATVDCANGAGLLNAEFSNLVPDGVYTMWTWYSPQVPGDEFVTFDLPAGAPDGTTSAFKADAKGNAVYSARFDSCLQGGGSQLMAGLAIAYHSDGRTYGTEPGPIGDKAHIHLFTLLPDDSEMPH